MSKVEIKNLKGLNVKSWGRKLKKFLLQLFYYIVINLLQWNIYNIIKIMEKYLGKQCIRLEKI